jgi:hypothetical protein
MILEGLVTTLSREDRVNLAPMGPRVEPAMTRFTLRPFRTATTYANLRERGEGVLHVTDDVLLLAQAAIGAIEPWPVLRPAEQVHGHYLADACRAYEFRVITCDESGERAAFVCEAVHVHRLRDFFGLNRAMHAVVEAAILATRVHLLPAQEIAADLRRLAPLVEKTGGPRETQAFDLLSTYVARQAATQER